ncbi:MAG: ABC transporter ATP-binding protein [Dehalococcoidales bacterium]|nr:ABC transporter ATP-binding protein [Dehalococcoidales bacterium]
MNKDIPVASTWAIEARGLEKSFGEHRALRGIDLKVTRNESLVIFGPNGAGKTTLLKILSTLVKPSAGSVWLDGIDIRDKSAQIRHKISLVSHQTFLYDNLTVFENLKFYGKMYDVADLEKRIKEVIAWVQLESRLHDRAGTLSRGLQQRASIARAVLHNPSILFLDEPDVGLDPHASAMVRDILGSINSGSRTVVMTTHNLERGLELGDSIVILDRGKVVYQATREAISEVNFRQIYDRYTETGR